MTIELLCCWDLFFTILVDELFWLKWNEREQC